MLERAKHNSPFLHIFFSKTKGKYKENRRNNVCLLLSSVVLSSSYSAFMYVLSDSFSNGAIP